MIYIITIMQIHHQKTHIALNFCILNGIYHKNQFITINDAK
jgi:hypothetical protein